MMSIKPALVIFSQWYAPAYEAGGPVVSLLNLSESISKNVPVYVVAGNKQPSGTKLNIDDNSSAAFSSSNITVLRGSGLFFTIKTVFKLWQKPHHYTWYYNDIFMLSWYILPRFMQALSRREGERQILATRGMLLPGAIQQKAWKKRIFLGLYSFYNYWFPVSFHFTSEKEKTAAQNLISAPFTYTIPNLAPKIEWLESNVVKHAGNLRIGLVGRIHPIKNLHWILDAIRALPTELHSKVSVDFYGNIENSDYQRELEDVAVEMRDTSIKFHGGFTPIELEDIYRSFDALCCPSLSENYGQSIAQALAWGIPVIASENTPWVNLKDFNAGFNVDPSDASGSADQLTKYINCTSEEWTLLRKTVHTYAKARFNREAQLLAYREMFGIQND